MTRTATFLLWFASLTISTISQAECRALVVANTSSAPSKYAPGDIIETGVAIEPANNETVTILTGDVIRSVAAGESFIVEDAEIASRLYEIADAIKSALAAWQPKEIRGGGKPKPQNVWYIDVSTAATYCLPESRAAILWRPDSNVSRQAVIVDLATGQEYWHFWKSGTATASWFADAITFNRYIVDGSSVGPRRIEVNEISFASATEMLERMAKHNCQYQIFQMSRFGADEIRQAFPD